MDSEYMKNLPQAVALIILIAILLLVLVRFGFMGCGDLPGLCAITKMIWPPSIAIVYGDEGMGDPDALSRYIIEETHMFPTKIRVEMVRDSATIDKYQLVIVERAKNMSTETMRAFQQYVQKGGRLVWIGDAGTALEPRDYVCESLAMDYLPASKENSEAAIICMTISDDNRGEKPAPDEGAQQLPFDAITSTDVSEAKIRCLKGECDRIEFMGWRGVCERAQELADGEVCGSWQAMAPNKPEGLKAGLCNRTYEDIVLMYIRQRTKLYDDMERYGFTFCGDEEDALHISVAPRISMCVDMVEKEMRDAGLFAAGENLYNARAGDATLKDYIIRNCTYQYNYWRRGPTKSELDEVIGGIDFAQMVLAADYISNYDGIRGKGIEMYLQAPDPEHTLVRGYEAAGNVTRHFGTSNISLVTTARFANVGRTSTVMYFNARGGKIPDKVDGKEVWPAIIVSSPTLSINKRGLVVYYAFAPEELAKQGYGLRLINNMMAFTLDQ